MGKNRKTDREIERRWLEMQYYGSDDRRKHRNFHRKAAADCLKIQMPGLAKRHQKLARNG